MSYYDTDLDDDDDDDFDLDFEMDDDEKAPRPRPSSRPRPGKPSFARPRAYGRDVKGRDAGLIKTPNGEAKIQLPGKFPTVGEFRGSLEEIQGDIKKNADGIKSLTRRGDDQDSRIAKLARTVERSSSLTFWSSLVLGAITAAPLLFNALEQGGDQ